MFLQNLSTMNILDPILYRTLFLQFSLLTSLCIQPISIGYKLDKEPLFNTQYKNILYGKDIAH